MERASETRVLDHAVDAVLAARKAAVAVGELFDRIIESQPTATYSGRVIAGLMAAHLLHLDRIEQELIDAGDLIDQGEK